MESVGGCKQDWNGKILVLREKKNKFSLTQVHVTAEAYIKSCSMKKPIIFLFPPKCNVTLYPLEFLPP